MVIFLFVFGVLRNSCVDLPFVIFFGLRCILLLGLFCRCFFVTRSFLDLACDSCHFKINFNIFVFFCGFRRFLLVFSDSLALSASIALFFVPKDPLGPDFGPKQNVVKKLFRPFPLGKNLKTCLTPAVLKLCFGPKSCPRGSFGTKKNAIDAENAGESETTAQNLNNN